MKGKKKMAATLTPEILRAAAAVWGSKGGKIGGKSKSPAKLKALEQNRNLRGRPKKSTA